MLFHYLKVSFRQLMKNKVQYTLSILGIAIGLLCFSTFNYYIKEAFDQYEAWPNYKNMAYFYIDSEKDQVRWDLDEPTLQQLIENPVVGIEGIAYLKRMNSSLSFFKDGKEVKVSKSVYAINTDFIETFSLQTIDGRTPELLSDRVLITQTYAGYLFGDENPIGKEIWLAWDENSSSTYTVSGVLKDFSPRLQKTYEASDVYILYEAAILDRIPGARVFSPTLLCAKNASLKEINQRLKGRFPFYSEKGQEIIVKSISEPRDFSERLIRFTILSLASLILISAMINFLKFTIQSFVSRTRELSLRKSLGSNNIRLFAMLFTEVLIVLTLSMIASYFVTKLFLWFYYNYLPLAMVQNGTIHIDEWRLFSQQLEQMFYLLVISTIVCLLALVRIKWTNIVVGIHSAGQGKHKLRNFFLCFQLIICFFFSGFSIAVVDFYLGQEKLRNKTLTDEECGRIWYVQLTSDRRFDYTAEVISDIRSLNLVEDVLLYKRLSPKTVVTDSAEFTARTYFAGENYGRFMNLPISGRMPSNANEVAVSRSLKQALEKAGNADNFRIGDEHYRITGTYESLPFELPESSPYSEISLSVIIYVPENEISVGFYIKAIAGQEEKAREAILETTQKHIPGFEKHLLVGMHDENRLSFGGAKMASDLLLLLSIVSLLITSLGIYSAITLDTRGRRKEVAIRKINGAGKKEIALLFGKLYIVLLAISAVIILPVNYLICRQSGPPFGFFHLLVTLLIVNGIVFITVFWRIRQISKVNPAEVIKSE